MNFQTPLSITIPPNEYDMEVQDNDHIQNVHNQSWPLTFNQQPLLTSKSPETDSLTQLNMEVGNKYTYRVYSLESASFEGTSDPRKEYDNPTFTTESTGPYKDLYYKCVYEQPHTERSAIRHKLEKEVEMDGPAAKRHRGELGGVEIVHPVIVPPNAVEVNAKMGYKK